MKWVPVAISSEGTSLQATFLTPMPWGGCSSPVVYGEEHLASPLFSEATGGAIPRLLFYLLCQ